MKLLIKRFSHEDKQTLGNAIVFNNRNGIEHTFKTLELPWKDNQKQISCIPTGTYKVKKRTSQKYKEHFHVLGVPGRSYILIHHGNYYDDILGCILPGIKHADIDGDGYRDVTSSRTTMKKLLSLLPNEFEMVIENQ